MYTVFNLIRNVNTLFNSLNNTILFYKSEFTSRFINLSNELLETLRRITENCKDNIKKNYLEFRKSVIFIEDRLTWSRVFEQPRKKNIIKKLSNELIIDTDDKLKEMLCENCKRKRFKIKLLNISNKLIDKNDWLMAYLSNGLLETLNTIENCISCIVNYCDEFHESVNA